MAEIKLTKNELRDQQNLLAQLQRYLPTLQLKKAMLQSEVQEARVAIEQQQEEFARARTLVEGYSELLAENIGIDLTAAAVIEKIHKHYDNIAGVDVPVFDGVDFAALKYHLFETPPWVDGAIAHLQKMVEKQVHVAIAEEKKEALEAELREVSIRVNLFEKILIPRCEVNIKKIQVFLGDQQLSAVCQAKVAKTKIEANKTQEHVYAY